MTKESQRSDQPSLEGELQLPFCEQKNAWFFDQNGDFEFNTGDRITYVISVGELDQVGKVDCSICCQRQSGQAVFGLATLSD